MDQVKNEGVKLPSIFDLFRQYLDSQNDLDKRTKDLMCELFQKCMSLEGDWESEDIFSEEDTIGDKIEKEIKDFLEKLNPE